MYYRVSSWQKIYSMKYLPYLFIIILSAFSLKALFSSSYLPLMHDQVQGERVYELAKSLSFGQFPVRFVGDLGYGLGYPLFNHYAPLPYYIGAIIFLLGANLITATKIMIVIPFIASGIGMYLFTNKFWGRMGALYSAILYMLAPYHGVQLYVRGSVGELYTYALLPFICIGLSELWKEKPRRGNLLIGLISLSLLVLSHTIGIYMFIFLYGVYFISSALYLKSKKKDQLQGWIKRHVLLIGIAFSLSAFFWIPAIIEIKYTDFSIASGNNVNYQEHFISLNQLWNSPWGFGGSTKGDQADGLSFMLGKISIVLSFVVILFLIAGKLKFIKYKLEHQYILIISSITLLLSIFLLTEFSISLWKLVPYMPMIQFPWRFIIFAVFALSVISGSFVGILRHYTPSKYFLFLTIIIIVCITVNVLFREKIPVNLTTKYFEKNGDYKLSEAQLKDSNHLRFNASIISDEYMPKGRIKPISLSEVSTDTISCTSLCLVRNVVITPTEYSFKITNEINSPVFIDKLYYPQFSVKVDNNYAEVLKGPENMLGVRVPAGEHSVSFELKNTWTRTFSNMISLISFLSLILYPVRGKLWNMKLKQKLLKI